MNVHVVTQVAQAISNWLPAGSRFIIGRDARHGSEDFANVTARVIRDAGHFPALFTEPVPTPVVSHEIGRTSAAGGVMVTASHNPATDNGYKVYRADGGQILPQDANHIEALMSAEPWPESVNSEYPDGIEELGATEIDLYMRAIGVTDSTASRRLKIAYTALHGVGGDVFVRALTEAGHEVHTVAEQQLPNPGFPTAPFPNPEEPGTLDMVIALAEDVSADLVLANDPDADRLAVAVRRTSGWEKLTGDQIGVLLGASIMGQTTGPRSVATTIVSSSLLAKVADAAGVTCHTTLTGFKWLSRAADHTGAPLVFAYEEAIGYSVQPAIRDKDGISAGLRFAELTADCLSHGETIDALLQDLYQVHGYHLTAQVSARFDGPDSMVQMSTKMTELRDSSPAEIAGNGVGVVIDLLNGHGELAPSDVLIYELDGGRVIVRPSGTEPKLKAYLEVVDTTHAMAQRRLDELVVGVEGLVR